MSEAMLHPDKVLYRGTGSAQGVLPNLSVCEHFAGDEKRLRKALALQESLGPVFDITADCEDGAAVGNPREQAEMAAEIIRCKENHFGLVGARIHEVSHPMWRVELDILLRVAGTRIAYVVLPKVESADDVRMQVAELNKLRLQYGIEQAIPVHVLIETPSALRAVWDIAAIQQVVSLDFGLMDFVSSHYGAIPSAVMYSPLQFEHVLIVRAKCEVTSAALAFHRIPTHNVTTEIQDTSVVFADAKKAHQNFGFLRMWSIHPNQIRPIISAMQPDAEELTLAQEILLRAQRASWAPLAVHGRLHDRASYRYYWELLRRAYVTGMVIDHQVQQQFFPSTLQS